MALRANGPGATLGRREDGSSAPVYLPVFQARMSVRSTILFSNLTVETEDLPRLFFVANILTEHARRLLAASSHSWHARVAGDGGREHVQIGLQERCCIVFACPSFSVLIINWA